jgi:Putative zinc-finger
MDCRERHPALLRLADGELQGEPARELRSHLTSCAACAETLDLFETEVGAITAALDATPKPRLTPLFPRLGAAAVLLLLGGGVLFGLLIFYEKLGRARTRVAAREEALLLTRVTITAEDVPLETFLSDLSDHVGGEVLLAPEVQFEPGTEPRVDLRLVQPIMLGSILGLLEDFYDLESSVESTARGVRVVLSPGRKP